MANLIALLAQGVVSFFAFCDKAFYQNLVATFIGALLGIPAGLFLEAMIERYRSRKETYQKKEKQKLIVDALRKSLDTNVKILNEICDGYSMNTNPEAEKGFLVFKYVDTCFLDYFTTNLDFIDNVDLLIKIAEIRHNLSSLQHQLSFVIEMNYSAVASLPNFSQNMANLAKSIIDRSRKIIEELKNVTALIDTIYM